MNERIRELNMKAAEYATAQCPSHSRDWYPIQNTKFAELIIRECARVASDYDGAHYVGTAIEKHFGVEE